MNQTVLSCIDLITAGEMLNERSLKHAMRATSQMRISSQVFESIKTLCLLGRGAPVPEAVVDLEDEARKAAGMLSTMLPDRDVRVDIRASDDKAVVRGGKMVYDVILDALTSMAQLDSSDVLSIDADIRQVKDGDAWEVRISDEHASLPESFDTESPTADLDEKRSRTVRVAGLLLSKMMAERLGGSVKAEAAEQGGCSLIITLKAEVPE
ncbi:MAG: hypothetical protein JSV90_05175 [Methanobacteriota archaeon]|nr:MAG: hypothetical protein JSV90_05175 [Euryarchaeota archaeon]